MRSRLPAIVRAAKRLKLHLPFIVTFFAHRITNGVAEGLNDLIATLQKRAYGYRNFERFKTVVFFHCGGLQLEPATHRLPGCPGVPIPSHVAEQTRGETTFAKRLT